MIVGKFLHPGRRNGNDGDPKPKSGQERCSDVHVQGHFANHVQAQARQQTEKSCADDNLQRHFSLQPPDDSHGYDNGSAQRCDGVGDLQAVVVEKISQHKRQYVQQAVQNKPGKEVAEKQQVRFTFLPQIRHRDGLRLLVLLRYSRRFERGNHGQQREQHQRTICQKGEPPGRKMTDQPSTDGAASRCKRTRGAPGADRLPIALFPKPLQQDHQTDGHENGRTDTLNEAAGQQERKGAAEIPEERACCIQCQPAEEHPDVSKTVRHSAHEYHEQSERQNVQIHDPDRCGQTGCELFLDLRQQDVQQRSILHHSEQADDD